MLCDRCKVNTATTHLHHTINGEEKELHLCASCADEIGIQNAMLNPFDFDFDFSNLLGQFFSQAAFNNKESLQVRKRCSNCGISFQDIVNSGNAGCAQCYQEFYSELLPSIQRIHGKTEHVGKISRQTGSAAKKENQIKKYKIELQRAIDEQNFEKAAELRDLIKNSESNSEEVENNG
jgi:protein arginine kinase activator